MPLCLSVQLIKYNQSLLKNSPDAILFRGLEFYGKNLNQEIRIYRNDIGIEYSDSEFYEKDYFYK